MQRPTKPYATSMPLQGEEVRVSTGEGHRINAAITRGPASEILVDGRPLRAFEGESVAAARSTGSPREISTSRTHVRSGKIPSGESSFVTSSTRSLIELRYSRIPRCSASGEAMPLGALLPGRSRCGRLVGLWCRIDTRGSSGQSFVDHRLEQLKVQRPNQLTPINNKPGRPPQA